VNLALELNEFHGLCGRLNGMLLRLSNTKFPIVTTKQVGLAGRVIHPK
jgi:hypothetical protein